MSLRTWMCTVVAVSAGLAPIPRAEAQEQQTSAQEAMNLWMAAGTPGAPHQRLNAMVGTWETTNSFWTEGPDKPPTTSKGTAVITWIFGGRFLRQEAGGEMMGMPFNGLGITGYDNLHKMYVGVWLDNSSTALYFSEGTMDTSTRVLTMFGTTDDPVSGQHNKMAKYVTRFINPDKFILEMHDLSLPGSNTKTGETVYTRKKQ